MIRVIGAARRSARGDRGITLIETLVAMVVSSVIVILLATMTITMFRGATYATNDFNAVSSSSTTVDRLLFELRQARLVYGPNANRTFCPSGSTATTICFWVDYNGDNQQDTSEQVTYTLTTGSNGGYVLKRYTAAAGAGSSTTVDTGVANLPTVFTYSDPTGTSMTASSISLSNPVAAVNVALSQAAASGTHQPGARDTGTEVRLRNAAGS